MRSLIVAIGLALALTFAGWPLSPAGRPTEADRDRCDYEWFEDAQGNVGAVRVFNPLNPCPGPPASITIITPFDDTPCASVGAITIVVLDKMENDVENGTPVSVTSSLGTASSGATYGGLFVSSLLMPPRVAGTAEIRVVAGSISAQKTLQVTCG